MRRTGAIAVSLAAAGILLLTGCSTSIDVDAIESSVAADLAAQVGGEWTVQCPDDIPLEQGLTANCGATSADGQSTMINVTQTDDQGNITWETAE